MYLTVFQAIILGLVQGFTEFLPVSSSGHLVLAQRFFGLNEHLLTFDILVHTGTLLAVVAVFYRSIISITLGCIEGVKSALLEKRTVGHVYRNSHEVRTALAIIIGTIPAVIIGVAFADLIEALFSSVFHVLVALSITGIILIATFFVRRGEHRIGIKRGILVGLAQAAAIFPGISRSGSTIATALFLKVNRREAGEFSFLLAIPAIVGATVFAFKDMAGGLFGLPVSIILFGVATSFLSGYVSLILLMKIIRRGRIGYFGFYCLALAIAGITYLTALR